MTDTETIAKIKFLLQIDNLRNAIRSYKFIHVFKNGKFNKSIVEFISKHFPASEHCFVFIGGLPDFPPPVGENVFSAPSPLCLAVSDAVSKVIFHGLYNYEVIEYLYEHPEIMQKSYWVPLGGDLHEAPNTPVDNYVRSNFQGCLANAYTRKIYEQKYGKGKKFFPFSISFNSIDYSTIMATPVPEKDYIQIQVNNSTHESTLEIFDSLSKFTAENIRIVSVLSYGRQEWREVILKAGEKIFGRNFFPILDYIPAEKYIKLLARNDVYIMNQQRPQGMTTAFTSMLLGEKVFMRGSISEYLFEEGYTLYDTATLPQLSFAELLENPAKEENRRRAAQRFDEDFVKQIWSNLFEYKQNEDM